MGVPCKLGADGIEQVIEVELTDCREGRARTQRRRGARARRSARLQLTARSDTPRVATRRIAWRPVLAVVVALPVLWFASPGGHPNELRVFLVPLAAALVLGCGRRFIRDFAPLALGVFVYEWARTLAHRVQSRRVLPAAARRRSRDRPRHDADRSAPGVAVRRPPALARSRADLPALAALRRTARRAVRGLAHVQAVLRAGAPRRCSRRRSPPRSCSSSSPPPHPGWPCAPGCCTASCGSARSTRPRARTARCSTCSTTTPSRRCRPCTPPTPCSWC